MRVILAERARGMFFFINIPYYYQWIYLNDPLVGAMQTFNRVVINSLPLRELCTKIIVEHA